MEEVVEEEAEEEEVEEKVQKVEEGGGGRGGVVDIKILYFDLEINLCGSPPGIWLSSSAPAFLYHLCI